MATQPAVDFVPLANGNYLIVNEASGMVLSDPSLSGGTGTAIVQTQLNGGLNQQWQISSSRGPTAATRSVNASSGLVLDDPNAYDAGLIRPGPCGSPTAARTRNGI